MCFTFAGQITYSCLMGMTLLLTLISMFTPEWRNYTDNRGPIHYIVCMVVIVSDLCLLGQGSTQYGRSGIFTCRERDLGYCFTGHKTWENILTAVLIIAVILEVIALCWSVASLFACCFRKNILQPLPGFAAAIAFCLLTVVIWFGWSHQDELEQHIINISLNSNLGYSYYMCIGALTFATGSLLSGGITIFFANRDF